MSGRLRDEVLGADFGDQRLTKRLGLLVERVAENPEVCLPKVFTETELEGAYRFLNNERVSLEAIMAPHVEQTVQRCREGGTVVVAHDTTEFRFEGNARQGLGRLKAKGRGFYAHLALALRDHQGRDPLGVIAQQTVVRGAKQPKVHATVRRLAADKESRRWWEQVKVVDQRLGPTTSAIHVADREADTYECFMELLAARSRFVIRLAHDRKVAKRDGVGNLHDVLSTAITVAEREVQLGTRRGGKGTKGDKAHPPRESRLAKLAVSAVTVTLRRPRSTPTSWPEQMTLNVIRVMEVDAPSGCEPVEWKLVTSEPIETPQQILAAVDAYRARWVIEEFFKALKTGCAIEKRQHESLSALLNILGVCIPVAWQMLRLRTLARTSSDVPATTVLSPAHIQILMVHRRTKALMPALPTVRHALLAIAALGGHLKRNGEPGWITLGRGFQDLLVLEEGWQLASR
jgi:hypothetical protein